MDYIRYISSVLRQIGLWELVILMLSVIVGRFSVYDVSVVYTVYLSVLLVSVVSAVLWCHHQGKDNWNFQKWNLISGRFLRFVSRLGIIAVFLILGGILETHDAGNYLASKTSFYFLEMMAYCISSFNQYIMVSFFPLSYAITEFIFVGIRQESFSNK